MNATWDAILRSWPYCPGLVAGLVASAVVYGRGWARLRSRDPWRWRWDRLIAFWAGLLACAVALASPVEELTPFLFSVHMIQHVLLTMVAPPLLLLGAPMLPILLGLPSALREPVLAIAELRWLRYALAYATRPWAALGCFAVATWLWHVPYFYELAQRQPAWHYVEHASFVAAALVFWHAVVRPFPGKRRESPWVLVIVLLLADVQNTLLSAVFTFSDRLVYPSYAIVPRLGKWPAMSDQALAGVVMWMSGAAAFLLPLAAIGIKLLRSPASRRSEPVRQRRPSVATMPEPAARRSFDLLRMPVLGPFLSWRHARTVMQAAMLLLAIAIVVDGLRGPPASPMNLAGVLPWIHWRGLVMFGLLAVGNVSCMVCPFTLPRWLAGHWLPARHRWPRALRNRWLAIGLVVFFFWAYEALGLWSRPAWTAWIVIGYFVAAFCVDGWFQKSSFCKYVCPIGQFNFVQSLLSPWEVRVREASTCRACVTHDCLVGGPRGHGCQLQLFQPRKQGNLDCTFCLACVHACPAENVGLLAVVPASQLLRDPARSGVGRFSRRVDLAVLVALLVFGAFVNAAAMTAPVLDFEAWLSRACGVSTPVITSIGLLGGLAVLPAGVVTGAHALGRWLSGGMMSRQSSIRFLYALVPIGGAMWLAHYSFHFLASPAAFVPPMQRFAGGLLGSPELAGSCCVAAASWLVKLEIGILAGGLLGSLYVAYRLASSMFAPRRALAALAPWALVAVLLYVVGVCIVLSPMEMRGAVEFVR